MLTAAAFASAAALVATSLPSTNAHGYIAVPESQFKGPANSNWVVQIDPVWTSDKWNGNTAASVDVFTSLKSANNFKDLKTLMDDTSVYGADCGFTDPNGTPQPVPTDGKATFSRGLIHVGPCEIWLDDKKVLSEDDCYSKYGNENQDITTTFPVDYSSCANGGCKQMRFYWLAFQGLSDKTVWQSYKDCIPLQGSGGGSANTTSTSTSTSTSQTSQTSSAAGAQTPSTGSSKTPSSDDSKTPASGDSKTPSSSGNSTTPAPVSNNSPSTEAPTSESSSSDTPVATTAPSFSFK